MVIKLFRYSKENHFTEYNQFITQIEVEFTQYDKRKREEIELKCCRTTSADIYHYME